MVLRITLFLAAGERRVLYFWHSLANRLLTRSANIAADLNLTDIEPAIRRFARRWRRHSDQERWLRSRPRVDDQIGPARGAIYETPITYHGRTYAEGKKIGKKDAVGRVGAILRMRFTSRLYSDTGAANLDALSFAPKFNRWMAEPSLLDGNTVLEIGAGMGNMTRPLCVRRKLYIVTDSDAEHVERLRMMFRHRPAVHVAKLDAAVNSDFDPFRQSVDTVVCLNVLKHIKDDAAALMRIRTLLRENGWLILLVPNDPKAFGAIDRAVGHYRRYTRAHLAWLLNSAGFDVEGTLSFNRVSMPGWRFAGQVLKSAALSRTSLRLFDRFVWLWRRIDGCCRRIGFDRRDRAATGSRSRLRRLRFLEMRLPVAFSRHCRTRLVAACPGLPHNQPASNTSVPSRHNAASAATRTSLADRATVLRGFQSQ